MRQRFGWRLVLLLLLWGGIAYAQDADDPTPAPDADASPATFTNRPRPTEGTIEIGQTVQGVLSDDLPRAVYRVALQAGQTYRINLRSEDFDTYMLVTDENERPITDDDDGGDGTNSRLVAFTPSADGVYRVEVTSFPFVTTATPVAGGFTLRVDAVRTQQIADNEPLQGELGLGELVVYTFNGQEGELVVISAISEAFDTVLTLSQGGEQIAADDDGGEGTNSMLGPVTLPADGVYVVGVRGFSADATGAFEVALGRSEARVVDYGERLTLNAVAGIPEVVQLEAFDGDLVELRLSGEDAVFVMRAPAGEPITEGVTRFTGNADEAPPILFEVLETGAHALVILPLASGTIEVSMVLGRYAPVNEIGTLVSMNQDGQGFAQFDVEAGERVTLTFIAQDNPRWELDVNVMQNEQVVARYSGFGGAALTFTVTFAEAGTVQLRLRDFAFTDAYQVQAVRPVPEEKD